MSTIPMDSQEVPRTTAAGTMLLVDVGGSKVVVASVERGEIAGRRRIERIGDVKTGDRLVGLIADAARDLAWRADGRGRVVMATPGIVDRNGTGITAASNVPLAGFALSRAVERALGAREVILEDDANCGALGERSRGAARGFDNVTYVSLSTGLGVGSISAGRLIIGEDHRAGELGHMVVVDGGARCGCGNRGCLEAYCSGRGFARAAVLAGFGGATRDGADRADRTDPVNTDITGRRVVEAAERGDARCRDVVAAGLLHLATGIHAICALLDPGIVVFGGGLMKNGWFCAEVLRRARGLNLRHPRTTFAAGGLGDDAVLVGALGIGLATSQADGA